MINKANEIAKNNFNDSIKLKSAIVSSSLINQIGEVGLSMIDLLQKGGKIFFAGNGGSFADSQHLTAEFISRFLFDRNALPAIALGTNSSNMSAIGNDYDYEKVFSRELYALGSKKDMFIPITTSGNSKNLIKAVNTANDKGMITIALTGATGGALNKLCECIKVPSKSVPRIQECHILIGHILCQIAEEGIFKPEGILND
ncbi:SIS domain-containing protein [Alphaproteobacteria bacterium]|nr:SIS domain-containing protein [Alphaproteobacteria bacterium]